MAAERSTIRPVETRPVETEYESEREYRDIHYRPEVDFRGDRVYWGPIIAGFLTALTTMALLSLLGLAIGFTSLNAGQAATQTTPVTESGMNSMIWAGIAGIIAFLLGGFVTGRTAATYDRGWGMLNGMLVFMLMLPFSLWFATVGLGAIAGGLGSFAGGLASGFGPQAGDAARQVAPNVPSNIDVAGAATRAAEAVRNTAWGALLGGILGLVAAGLGGYLGTRTGHVAYTTHTTDR
jgi:hypothetical protein